MIHVQAERLKYELALRGISLSDIAREIGVTQPYVSAVVRGHRNTWVSTSRRIEALIAQKLGKPVQEVFPDRYVEDSSQSSPSMPKSGEIVTFQREGA